VDDRGRRIGYNEAVFREVNERVAELENHFGTEGPIEFICECGESACTARMPLLRAEYEAVRAEPTRFAIVPGHDVPDLERVVSETDRFVVVEKRAGEPARIAEELDPRR
jgi:hypothetical protein